MNRPFNAKDVLDFLDNCVVQNPGFFFMDLEHGYFDTANSRLSLYADRARWAIVFEKNGFANRGGRIELELNYFGNCLRNLEPGGLYYHFNYNSKYFSLVSGDSLEKIQGEFEDVLPDAKEIMIRDQSVPLPSSKEEYKKWIPDLAPSSDVHFRDLARYLAYEHEALMRASDEEKRMCIPDDIPLLMTIDAWNHRSYSFYRNGQDAHVTGTVPSSHETFQLIAETLAHQDPKKFKPTVAPNNHWKFWPEAGSL